MPVYWANEVETETKCPVCGGTLTVRVDSRGHRIVSLCIRCQEAKKPK